MRQGRRLGTLAVLALAAVVGCGGGDGYDRLYERLSEEPAAFDRGVLAGRRIVVDPGHGGEFDGARGGGGLAEAEVNLGVALHLWGMLDDAGADVRLTRTTDRDFLPEDGTEVRDDLAARIEEANAFLPEVFLSIHHNASFARDRGRNGIEVYYRGDDPGASLELGRDVLLHLARNLGIPSGEIRPGNYFVLRRSVAGAAILTEASYLSNPAVEDRLRLAEKQRLEAEALFLGLVGYFSRGVPTVERLLPATDTLSAPAEVFFRAVPAAGIPLDPSSATVRVDDRTVPAVFDGGSIRWTIPASAPNEPMRVQGSIRSARGATVASAPATLLLARPAVHLLPLPAERERNGRWRIGVAVLDAEGRAVADGTLVTTTLPGGALVERRSRAGRIEMIVPDADGPFVVSAASRRDTLRFGKSDGGTPALVLDARSGDPVPFPVAAGLPGVSSTGDRAGRLSLPVGGGFVLVSARGYLPERIEAPGDTIGVLLRLEPLFGGCLLGRAVAVDAAGGGADLDGLGDGRLRGADVNIETARRLATMLEASGARVLLVRRGEETLSPHDRVARVNAAGVDAALRIGRASGNDACVVRHYPGSLRGAALARLLADALAGLPPCRETAVGEATDPFLQQTNCPACVARSGPVEGDAERLFSHHARPAIEAERLFAALVAFFGDERTAQRPVVATDGGLPVAGALVCLDGTVSLETDETGVVRFTCVTPGRHVLGCAWPDGRETALFFDADVSPVDTLRIERRP
ncbi:MAG: N-acetylmuramoyl-L-alanine amidase [Candidatus Krumholzibacteriota bacterium]|nr:N-acetylmuramoyl-L-alanine amidase [Candidatus Krumholzibacteriota bacterium]